MQRRVLATIAASVLAAAPVAAQEPSGPQILVNVHTVAAWEFHPSVATDAWGRELFIATKNAG